MQKELVSNGTSNDGAKPDHRWRPPLVCPTVCTHHWSFLTCTRPLLTHSLRGYGIRWGWGMWIKVKQNLTVTVCLRLNRDLFEAAPTFKDFSLSVRVICRSANPFSRHTLSKHKHNPCECDSFTAVKFSSFQKDPELATYLRRVYFRIQYIHVPTQCWLRALMRLIACSRLGPFCVAPVRFPSLVHHPRVLSLLSGPFILCISTCTWYCLGWILSAASHRHRIGGCRSCRRITAAIFREEF